MNDDPSATNQKGTSEALETLRVELPASLVAALRQAVARQPPERTGGSLDVLVANALRHWLRTSGDRPLSGARGDGSGHTPDGWYD